MAPHKLRADRALDEVDWVLGIGGIDVKLGVTVGRDISLEKLELEYDAVFVGVGLGSDTRLGVPGEDLAGVHGAVAWIEKMKLGQGRPDQREALRGGRRRQHGDRRGARGQDAGHPRGDDALPRQRGAHVAATRTSGKRRPFEGVRAEWHALPIAFEGGSSVARAHCVRLDEHKKPIAGANFAIEAELVLVAIGQGKLGASWSSSPGVTHDHGRLVTDAQGLARARALVRRRRLLPTAATRSSTRSPTARRAAQAIHAFLSGVAHG